MDIRNITKGVFLNTLACPTLGWLMRSGQDIEQLSKEALTLGERFRIEEGLEVQRRARLIFPDGLLVKRASIDQALQQTENFISDPTASTIFEATFLADDCITKADVLKRKGNDWHLIEVKSSVNDKEEFIDDMAYTTMVAKRAGCNISTISLLLISKDYRLGMDDKDLFAEIDHTDDVLSTVEIFDEAFDKVRAITIAQSMPEPDLRRDCKHCPLFDDCLGKGIEHHILEIPRLHHTKLELLKEEGVICVEDIPGNFPLTQNQARVRDAVVSKESYVSDNLRDSLDSVVWPAFYLDFETTQTAIPLFPGIAPHTQLPTQYSIHELSDVGNIVDHLEFLADPTKDCRKELVLNLIKDLKEKGSIIVYSNFEKTTIGKLKQLYPELADKLDSLVERIVDLEAFIRSNFYHPDFHGSTSIKVTLPVMVPEMSYSDLEIAEGGSAMAAFAYLALGKYAEGVEADTVKRNLLEYCKRDTLAMVKLHEKLQGMCN